MVDGHLAGVFYSAHNHLRASVSPVAEMLVWLERYGEFVEQAQVEVFCYDARAA